MSLNKHVLFSPRNCNLSFQFVLNEHKEVLGVNPQVVKKILSVLLHLSYRCAPVQGLGFAEALT